MVNSNAVDSVIYRIREETRIHHTCLPWDRMSHFYQRKCRDSQAILPKYHESFGPVDGDQEKSDGFRSDGDWDESFWTQTWVKAVTGPLELGLLAPPFLLPRSRCNLQLATSFDFPNLSENEIVWFTLFQFSKATVIPRDISFNVNFLTKALNIILKCCYIIAILTFSHSQLSTIFFL